MPQSSGFDMTPWPGLRDAVISTISLHRQHTMFGMVEADITDAWTRMAVLRREHRVAVAPHAYFLYCLAQVLCRFPPLNSYRKGRHLVTFHDVDIGTTAEKMDPDSRERYAAGFVIRRAQSLSLAQVNDAVRRSLRRSPGDDPGAVLRRKMARLPALVRWFLRRRMAADPLRFRQVYGTAGLTNLHLADVGHPYIAIPPNPYTLTVAMGGMARRHVLDAAGRVQQRRMIPVTMAVDHALVDGIMACRFGRALVHQLESGAGLDDEFVRQSRALREQHP
ncbi:MAG: 2-oxo acid dehydrogenase subunit E2 [Magnetococcus sp. WYHC-3]